MKEFKNLREMKKSLNTIKSGVAQDTIFSAKVIYFIAKKLDELVEVTRAKHLSDYHLFMSYKLKVENADFMDAVKEWRKLHEPKL